MHATHLYDLGLVAVSHIYLMPVQLVVVLVTRWSKECVRRWHMYAEDTRLLQSYVARSACRNIHAYPGTVSRLAILTRSFSILHIHNIITWLRLFCRQQQGSDPAAGDKISAIKYTEFCLVNQFYWTNPRIALVPGWSRWSQDDHAGPRMIALVAGWSRWSQD